MNLTWLAFIGDLMFTFFCQIGFILQKLAHRHQEKAQKQMKEDAKSTDIDQNHVATTYFSWRFFLGLCIIITASFGHIGLMPHLDLTLMGCNAAFAIMSSMFLSIKWLGESFIPKHDVTAVVLISLGCASIVINVNTDPIEFTADEAIELITSGRSVAFFLMTIVGYLITALVTKCFLEALRRFELDIDVYDEHQAANSADYVPILAAREKRALRDSR